MKKGWKRQELIIRLQWSALEITKKFLKNFCIVLQIAYEQKDYDGVLKAIHALKGFSGTLAMEGVYQASSAVVDNIRKEEYDKLPHNMEWLEKEYKRVMQIYQDT